MNTLVKTRGGRAEGTEYRKFEVGYRRCNVKVNDTVTPDMVIGHHYKSGQPMRSDFNGQVATIYFNPMHDSLMVMVVMGATRN